MPVSDAARPAGHPGLVEEQVESTDVTPSVSRPRALLDAVAGRIPSRWRLPLATYLACQVIFLFWWAAFYPALMSYDSVTYVLHVTTGPWVASHSVLYDSMVWLSLHTTGDLAALALAQTVAMSVALAYTVAAFRRLGVPGRWTAVAAVIAAALPSTGTFIVYIWKDVPFSICAYLTVPTLAHLVSLRGSPEWRRDRRVRLLIVALGLELLGVCLFRLNGFLIVLIAACALVCLLPGIRVRLSAAAAAAICLTFVLNLYVYPAVGIQRPPSYLVYFTEYSDIGVAYTAAPWTFTAADTQLMARVAPLPAWKAAATCYGSDPTTRIPGFTAHAAKLSGQLMSLWFRVLRRSPNLILSARICRGSIAWSLFSGPARELAALTTGANVISSDLWGLDSLRDVRDNPYRHIMATRPLSGSLNSLARFLWAASTTPQLQWILWRAAFWCYVSYLAVFVFARRRRNWALLSMASIVVGQQLGVMADIPEQLFRYMVSSIFIGIMVVPLLFAGKRTAPSGRASPGPRESAALPGP